jgi:hypothetical protein
MARGMAPMVPMICARPHGTIDRFFTFIMPSATHNRHVSHMIV